MKNNFTFKNTSLPEPETIEEYIDRKIDEQFERYIDKQLNDMIDREIDKMIEDQIKRSQGNK